MKKGKIILIFGISAVGKTYYKQKLAEKFDLILLRRVITRELRPNEDQKTNIRVTKSKFIELRKNKKLLVFSKINNEYYGFLKEEIKMLDEGCNLIGDCYYKLLKKLKKTLGEKLVCIAIQPYNIENTIEVIRRERKDYQKRVLNARKEYNYIEKNKKIFDLVVYNDYSQLTDEKIVNGLRNILENN